MKAVTDLFEDVFFNSTFDLLLSTDDHELPTKVFLYYLRQLPAKMIASWEEFQQSQQYYSHRIVHALAKRVDLAALHEKLGPYLLSERKMMLFDQTELPAHDLDFLSDEALGSCLQALHPLNRHDSSSIDSGFCQISSVSTIICSHELSEILLGHLELFVFAAQHYSQLARSQPDESLHKKLLQHEISQLALNFPLTNTIKINDRTLFSFFGAYLKLLLQQQPASSCDLPDLGDHSSLVCFETCCMDLYSRGLDSGAVMLADHVVAPLVTFCGDANLPGRLGQLMKNLGFQLTQSGKNAPFFINPGWKDLNAKICLESISYHAHLRRKLSSSPLDCSAVPEREPVIYVVNLARNSLEAQISALQHCMFAHSHERSLVCFLGPACLLSYTQAEVASVTIKDLVDRVTEVATSLTRPRDYDTIDKIATFFESLVAGQTTIINSPSSVTVEDTDNMVGLNLSASWTTAAMKNQQQQSRKCQSAKPSMLRDLFLSSSQSTAAASSKHSPRHFKAALSQTLQPGQFLITARCNSSIYPDQAMTTPVSPDTSALSSASFSEFDLRRKSDHQACYKGWLKSSFSKTSSPSTTNGLSASSGGTLSTVPASGQNHKNSTNSRLQRIFKDSMERQQLMMDWLLRDLSDEAMPLARTVQCLVDTVVGDDDERDFAQPADSLAGLPMEAQRVTCPDMDLFSYHALQFLIQEFPASPLADIIRSLESKQCQSGQHLMFARGPQIADTCGHLLCTLGELREIRASCPLRSLSLDQPGKLQQQQSITTPVLDKCNSAPAGASNSSFDLPGLFGRRKKSCSSFTSSNLSTRSTSIRNIRGIISSIFDGRKDKSMESELANPYPADLFGASSMRQNGTQVGNSQHQHRGSNGSGNNPGLRPHHSGIMTNASSSVSGSVFSVRTGDSCSFACQYPHAHAKHRMMSEIITASSSSSSSSCCGQMHPLRADQAHHHHHPPMLGLRRERSRSISSPDGCPLSPISSQCPIIIDKEEMLHDFGMFQDAASAAHHAGGFPAWTKHELTTLHLCLGQCQLPPDSPTITAKNGPGDEETAISVTSTTSTTAAATAANNNTNQRLAQFIADLSGSSDSEMDFFRSKGQQQQQYVVVSAKNGNGAL